MTIELIDLNESELELNKRILLHILDKMAGYNTALRVQLEVSAPTISQSKGLLYTVRRMQDSQKLNYTGLESALVFLERGLNSKLNSGV